MFGKLLSRVTALVARPAPATQPGPLAPCTEPVGPVPPPEARRLILAGSAPAGLVVPGRLDLSGTAISELPAGLQAEVLNVCHCPRLEALPEGLQARTILGGGQTALRQLPAGLSCYRLELPGTRLESLPSDLRVEYRLNLQGCSRLRSLPAGLKVGSLVLRGCTALEELPEGLEVYFLDLAGCTGLRGWPTEGSVRVGSLNVSSCPWLTGLPAWVQDLAQLDVSNCENLRELPEGLRVSSWVDVAGTGLRGLPESMANTALRWRGVPVERRVAFAPETITAAEVLGERNAERRRVVLERMGYERFLAEADAQVRDRDRDPGGERRLLRVLLPGDEDLVCLSVFCPSTGRQYLLRVPPGTPTCRHAAAWIAGFNNPDDYRPVMET